MRHDDVPADPAEEIAEELEEIERRSPLARTLITVAATVVALGVLVGVVLLVSLAMRDTETASSSVDAADLPQVALRTGDADVTVVEGDGPGVSFRADVTSGVLPTDYELRQRGTEIEVVSGCFALLNPGCGVDVVVEVPQGLPVEVTSESGDVVADRMTDRVLTVVTGSGDVRADDLEVTELAATTSSGDVAASFAADPFAVKVTTGGGDVDVRLPAGGQDYRLDLRSTSGEVAQDVESADDADAFVRVHSESGDVALTR